MLSGNDIVSKEDKIKILENAKESYKTLKGAQNWNDILFCLTVQVHYVGELVQKMNPDTKS